MMNHAEVERWESLYDQVVAEGKFLWSVSFFITSGRKPGVRRRRLSGPLKSAALNRQSS